MSTKKNIPPFFMCPWDVTVAAAAQAVQRGDATAEQQRAFLKWLIHTAAGTYESTFHPDSDRGSAFAEGRRFVGLQTVKLLAISTKAFSTRDKE